MKNLQIFFIIIMFSVFFFGEETGAVTYYVSTTGDDGKSGLDTTNAWATIDHAAQTLEAGDTVLIMEGRYYESDIYPAHSGTYSNRIVYKAYPGADVWVDGQQTTNHMFNFGQEHRPDSARNHITMDSINIVNSGTVVGGNAWGGQAIFIWECKNLDFKNCIICSTQGHDNVAAFFIQFSDSIFIRNCLIFHNREDELDYNSAKENNTGITIYGSSTHDPEPYRSRWIRVENCEIWDMNVAIKYKAVGAPGPFYVLNNVIHDCRRGIKTRQDSSRIKHNVIYDCHNGIWVGFYTIVNVGGHYSEVINNTIVNMTGAGIFFEEYGGNGPESCVVKNNIIYDYGSYRGIAVWPEGSGAPDSFYSDYNCFYDASDYVHKWSGYTDYTLSEICSAKDCDCSSIKSDPKFIDPDKDDYRLQADSPCRGAADDGGDIGALQYDGEDGTPPYTTGHNPGRNATGVSVNTNISLHIQDSGDGVEISSIRLTVDGQQIVQSDLQITGDSTDYAVVYDPPMDFSYDSVITVSIDAQDLHNPPNVMPQDRYSFTIESAPDTIVPVIFQIEVTDITNTGATITWETDEPSDSQVEYGLSASYGFLSPLNSTLTTHHQVTLTDLTNSTTYHYRVLSSDNSGNGAMSEDSTFVTDSSATTTEEWGDGEGSDHPNTCFDTYVNVGSPSTNYSSDNLSLNSYTWPVNTIANDMIIKWNLSAIPPSTQIEKAQLYLYLIDTGGDEIYDLPIHKIINVNPTIGQCSWNTCDGTNPWTGGQDGGQQDIAPAEDVLQCDTETGYKVWDVTEMVRDWVANPSTNFGMMVNSDNTASRDSWRYFTPTESGHSAQRPRLIITYSVESSGPGRPGRPHWR